MKEKVRRYIDKALKKLAKQQSFKLPKQFSYDLEPPKSCAHGDLAANVALRLTSIVRQNPRDLGFAVKVLLDKQAKSSKEFQKIIRKVQVEGPGFINFFLTEDSRASVLLDIQKLNEEFGASKIGKGEKVLIEFVSANPTGPLTIAHGRQAAIGDTLANILTAVGFKVSREFYLNDTGRQIKLLGKSVWACYQRAAGKKEISLPEDGYRGGYIQELANELHRKTNGSLLQSDAEEAIRRSSEYAVEVLLGGIESDLKMIKVVFENYFSESKLHEDGKVEKAIEFLKKKKHLYEADRALWFRSTDFGDDKDRVLRKSNHDLTYLTADIAYHRSKFERGFKRVINLWGPDHHGYVMRLKAACEALGYDPKAISILLVQLTTLFRKGEPIRMSTRAGQFVTLHELVQEVGADATRFFFLMRRIESHLDFDLVLAKEKSQDNPVYYLQYAHARICSILRNAKQKINVQCDTSVLSEPQEFELMKKMTDFPEIIKQAARALEPYRLVDYLKELAALFHQFYSTRRVISDDESLTAARLLLTDSVRIVLRNGFQILGISQPESM